MSFLVDFVPNNCNALLLLFFFSINLIFLHEFLWSILWLNRKEYVTTVFHYVTAAVESSKVMVS
jgi:hypothetical protein